MKRLFNLVFVLFLALILMVCCVQPPLVPQHVKSHADDLIDKWNNVFGNVLQTVSRKYKSFVKSNKRLKEVVETLTDPDSVRLLHTNITDPGIAQSAFSFSGPTGTDSQQELADSVEDLIKTAQYLVEPNWILVLSGEEFSSILVLDDDCVVWESVIESILVKEV